MTVVALAVSGHGFGHAVRCAEVARVLIQRGARVKLRTDAPVWLFPPQAEIMPSAGWPLDVGVVQRDGLDLDVDATREQWQEFAGVFDARADSEAELLREHQVDALVGDIPPLAFAAAARARVPSAALANFGWDWIYGAWPCFDAIVARVREGYAQADLLLRLPLCSDAADAFAAFKRQEDVPLIARRAERSRAAVRAALGLADSARLVLLSFGGFAAQGLDLKALGRWSQYTFVVTPPLARAAVDPAPNVLVLERTPDDYVSLLAACDVVITKPGYGIVADCLANRVAMLYTDRGPFREYEVLARELARLGRGGYITREDLLRGDVGVAIDALMESTRPWAELRLDGAAVVADRVLQLVNQSGTLCARR